MVSLYVREKHFYWNIVALQCCVSFNWSTFCSLVFVLLLVSFSQFNANICAMLLLQSCPTLCDPMDCSLPGSSVHGILQARLLMWVAISSSRGSSWPGDGTHVCLHLLHLRQILCTLNHLGSPRVCVCVCMYVCIYNIYMYYIYLPQTDMVLMTKYKQLYEVLGKCRSRLKERIDSAVIMQICGKFY